MTCNPRMAGAVATLCLFALGDPALAQQKEHLLLYHPGF